MARTIDKRPVRIVGLAAALVLALLCGCMNVQKVHGTPAVLQKNIRSGELVRPGDQIAVVTTSQGERIFVVTDVDQDSIRGDGVAVAIDEVVALEKRELSTGRTGLAAFAFLMLAPVAGTILLAIVF